MGKFKKVFSSTEWETSKFGGFSQLLWDLPEMTMPYSFSVDLPEKSGYLDYYSKNKLLAYFLYKVKTKNLFSTLCVGVQKETISSPYGMGSRDEYTFSKEAVKNCLKLIIARESELKSLFINYSNLLSNSKLTCTRYGSQYDSTTITDEQYLLDKINSVAKKKEYAYFNTNFRADGSFTALKDKLKFNTPEESREITYTKLETEWAEKLTNLLDISFEQEITKITNLRTGKLDIPKIIESLSGNNLIYYTKELHDKTRPFTVCILNDESGSMDRPFEYRVQSDDNLASLTRSEMQHKLTKTLYKAFSEVLPPDKIFVYGHSGGATPVVHVYQDRYNPTFETTYNRQLYHDFRQNYDGPVISAIYDKIRSYTDEAILFIVISDGEPAGDHYGGIEDREDLKRIVEKCKRDSFVTCGIGFQYTGVKSLYNYSTVINNLSDAPNLVSMLINNVVKSEFQ